MTTDSTTAGHNWSEADPIIGTEKVLSLYVNPCMSGRFHARTQHSFKDCGSMWSKDGKNWVRFGSWANLQ